ncbi:MAG: hypothetical protein ABL964_07660 [Steroidobacteraceae bacterium]
MLNRRTFLQAGVTAVPLAAGAAMTLGAKQAKASDVPAIPLYTVVFDDRFADSVAFANEARWMGQRTSAIQGDVTKLWYDDLYHAWKQGPVAIAGLTTRDAMFCLEIFGNDAGLRLLVKGEHRIEAGRVEHRMNGPELAMAGTSLDKCGADWSGPLAQMLVGCPATREGRTEVTAVSGAKAAPEPVTLVSWLLAPRQRQV